MIEYALHQLIENFSLRLLYLVTGWFLLFGYGVHLLIVQALTKLPMGGVMRTVACLHVRTVMVAFLCAPVLGDITKMIFFSKYEGLFRGQSVYIWFVVIVAYVAAYIFCKSFATVKCVEFRRWLVGGNLMVGVLGYLVLKSINVIHFM